MVAKFKVSKWQNSDGKTNLIIDSLKDTQRRLIRTFPHFWKNNLTSLSKIEKLEISLK